MLFMVLLLLFSVPASSREFSNPLKPSEGADPSIVYVDGHYHLTYTTTRNIELIRATTLEGLKTGERKVVFKDTDPLRSFDVWAPEFHNFNGIWYVYYAASGEGDDVQFSWVLKGGANIWDDPYVLQGKIIKDIWAIDGTVLKIADASYFVFSRFDEVGQSVWIARMTSPTSISEQFVLTQPTEPWEQVGEPVNEGPHPLYHEDRVFVTFSGSFCATTNYSLGLLTYDGNGDPLNRASWGKSGPLFASANGNYGTGHNGFFTSPDGKEVWNVYHATSNYTGVCDEMRYTMASRVNWREDGSPDFGQAPPLGEVLDGPSGEQ